MLLWTLQCICLFELVFFFFFNIHPGVELLDHTVILFLFFSVITLLFSTVASPKYIPANSVTRFPFPTSLPTFVICVLLDDGRSDRCEVVSHWGFDLHFLDDCRRWASFHVPVGHLNFLFGKCLFSSTAHFSTEVFFCFFFFYWVIQAVYICWILTSYLSYHLQIFSPIQ